VVAVATNALAAVAKVAAFVVTGSVAVLAEAGRSLAGGAAQASLLARRRRRDPAAAGAPAGSERAQGFAPMTTSLVLCTAVAVAVVGLVVGLDRSAPLQDPVWVGAALGASLLLEGISLRTAVRGARAAGGDASLRQRLRQTTDPALPLVLHDRVAAMVGLVLASAGVAVAVATDDPRGDRAGALAVAVVVGAVVVATARAMRRLLVGAGAHPREDEALRAAIDIDPDVVRILQIQARYLGPEELLVAAKVELQHDLSLVQAVDTVERIERHVRLAVPAARHVYLEADVDPAHRQEAGYVVEHSGHIDPDDPRYAEITGAPVDDDDIWTE
jgi:cation diffusion facilitator family transporter